MRKLRIDISTSVTHRDFDLPDDWDDLTEHEQYRIIRDHSERLAAEVVDTYGEVVEVDDEDYAPLSVTLDETHRIAVARLAPGQTLTVAAPPCIVDITGKADYGWTTVSFDDFGVRPTFTSSREYVAGRFAGTGGLYREIDKGTRAIEAGDARVARVVFEPRGSKRKPTWYAIGHELVDGAA